MCVARKVSIPLYPISLPSREEYGDELLSCHDKVLEEREMNFVPHSQGRGQISDPEAQCLVGK